MDSPDPYGDHTYRSHESLVAHAADNWFQLVEYQAALVACGKLGYADAPLLHACLPPILAERYDERFLARFARVAGDFAMRVGERPTKPWPSCVAEELALVAIADLAELMGPDELALEVEPFSSEEYIESTMQDDDVRLLWHRAGRRAITTEALDYVNLDFESWFVPFPNATYPVAPAPSQEAIAHWIRTATSGD